MWIVVGGGLFYKDIALFNSFWFGEFFVLLGALQGLKYFPARLFTIKILGLFPNTVVFFHHI